MVLNELRKIQQEKGNNASENEAIEYFTNGNYNQNIVDVIISLSPLILNINLAIVTEDESVTNNLSLEIHQNVSHPENLIVVKRKIFSNLQCEKSIHYQLEIPLKDTIKYKIDIIKAQDPINRSILFSNGGSSNLITRNNRKKKV